MKTFDFSNTKGIRAVADHLDKLAEDPSISGPVQIGHLRIHGNMIALNRAATLLRKNSISGRICPAPPHPRPTWVKSSSNYHDNTSAIFSLDSVRHCGTPEAALETIRRQLATQAESMEPAAVARCQKAACEIESFLAREQALKDQKQADDAAEERIRKGIQPGLQDITPTGTEVIVTHSNSSYLGRVIDCKIGPDPVLGKKHPVAIHSVEITHIHETRQRRYALYPITKKQLINITPTKIRILPSLNVQASPSPTPIKHTQDMKNKTESTILQLPSKFISAAGTDKSRSVLLGVLIDAENRAVVACNGRILASIPIPGTADIAGGYITPELWKSAAIMAKKGPIILDYAAGTIAGLPYQNMEEWGMNYPDWKAVVPQKPDTAYEARLDPDLILAAALALGYQKDSAPSTECNGITLKFPRNYGAPVMLHVTGTSTGVIMTMGDEKNTQGYGLKIAHSTPSTAPDDRLSETQAQLEDANRCLEVTRTELTQARNRITALETAAKHRQAYADNATKQPTTPTPERSPATDSASSNSQPSTIDSQPLLTRNEPKNGIELRFPGKPTDETRDALKSHGFRWAPGQPDKPWIAKYTEERWVFATALAEGTTPTPIPEETEDPTTLTPEPPSSSLITDHSALGTSPTSKLPSAFDLF